ncbi:MAG TPA: bacterioferritin [Thermoanaerobaculia bacterium]
MKGDPEILKLLQEVLSAELTAINQYFIHARMLRNWRYMRLADHTEKESIGEMKHAQEAMDRILYFDGIPNMQKYMKINVGKSVPEMMKLDHALELDAVKRLNKGIALATEKGDNGSRALFERILVSEEEHIDWIEAQLQQIKDIGAENYLAQQIGEGGEAD